MIELLPAPGRDSKSNRPDIWVLGSLGKVEPHRAAALLDNRRTICGHEKGVIVDEINPRALHVQHIAMLLPVQISFSDEGGEDYADEMAV